MERFTSILPPTAAVPVIPSQTASPEQLAAEKFPEVNFHQQDTQSVGDGEVAVVADDADTAKGDSDDNSEVPPALFLDTISSVYRWLPEDKCPKMTLPPPMVRSLFEGAAPTPSQMPSLPFSPTVALLVSQMEGHLVEDGRRAGTYLPKKFLGSTAKYYKPHNSSWPVKPPTLDKDASLIGVAKPPTPVHSVAKVWDSTDARVRQIVAMASHIDLCLGASKGALVEEDTAELESLLTSAAVGARHIMATALAASSDILLWRRDAALASSSLLPGPAREALRAAPLSSASLLGGLCEKASKDDVTERQRLLITRQTGVGLSSSSKKKPSKPPYQKPKQNQARSSMYREVPKPEQAFRHPLPPPATYPVRGRGLGRGRARGFGVSSRRPRRGGR